MVVKLSLDRQTRQSLATVRTEREWQSVVVGEQDRQIKPAGPVLLCERALWPGEANAQPPVPSELIGGAGWDYAEQSAGAWILLDANNRGWRVWVQQ